MYLYYELFQSPSGNVEEDIYEFIMSSDGRSKFIDFKNPQEKIHHTIICQVYKAIPIASLSYEPSTYITTIIGLNGKKFVLQMETAKIQGLLPQLQIKQLTELRDKLYQGRLNYVAPPPPPEAKVTEIKFKEDEFFYTAPTANGELSGEVLYAALAKLLLITVSQLKAYAPSDLKKLYRLRAMALHPDRNNGAAGAMSELNYLWRLYNA